MSAASCTVTIAPMSSVSCRRDLAGFATTRVRAGPSARSTMTTIATTCSTSVRYHAGQRYQPRYMPPMTNVSAHALPVRCRAKAFSRNFTCCGNPSAWLCGHGIILHRRRLTGNGALLGQPGAEVDKPAALAAERAKRGALPRELTLAGGAVDAHRTHRPRPSAAAAEREGHVRLGLGRARGQSIPGEEADVAAVMTAADLRVEPRGGRQLDAEQLQRIVPIEGDVESTALGGLLAVAAVLTREPQELCDGVAHGAQQPQPLAEGAHSRLVGLRELEITVRQVELARTSGDGAALLDSAQEFRVPQGLQERLAG